MARASQSAKHEDVSAGMSGPVVERLVLAAKGNVHESREALFARAARLAYARALKLTGDTDTAWDVAQDAVAIAVRELPRLRKPSAFFAWLKAIVDRAAFAQHRGSDRRREVPLSDAIGLRSSAPGPPEVAERRETSELVRRAMAQLPPRDRVIVELFYFEDMSCREVAEFLRTSRDSVKTALHRSRTRMREEMATMSATTPRESVERPITAMMSSGDDSALRGDLQFKPDSPTARLYIGVYPTGDPAKAARALRMSGKDMQAELEWLEARKLIAREGKLWRCTMPVMGEDDLEIVRPWAAEVAAPVTEALDTLYGRLSTIARESVPAAARETVIAVGLWAEMAHRPFGAIERAMEVSPVERGEWGRASVAAVSARRGWPESYYGGINSGRWESDEFPGVRRHYVLSPRGTDQSAVVDFARSLGRTITGPDPKTGLVGFLCSLGYDPIAAGGVGARAAAFGLDVSDPSACLAGLERLHAVQVEDGRIELAIPVVPHDTWQGFLNELDRLGEDIVEAASGGADDLRERMLRCSFAECSFSDSVGLCIGLAQGLVQEAFHKRGWARFPDVADFSWGVMFVC